MTQPSNPARDDVVLTPTGLRVMGRRIPCTLGRGGRVRDKREGDMGTPVGIHRIVGLLYRPDRMARPADWAEPIRPRDIWCENPDCADYNLLVRAPHPCGEERLRRSDPLYDLVLVLDWNWPDPEPHRGSAIFLHQWRRPGYPTAGCIAVRRHHLQWIARQVVPGTRVVVRS